MNNKLLVCIGLLVPLSALMASDDQSDAGIVDMHDAIIAQGALAPLIEMTFEMERRQQKMQKIPNPTDAQKQVIEEHGKLTKFLRDTRDDINELRADRKEKLRGQQEYETYLQDWMKRDQEAEETDDLDDLNALKAGTKRLEELFAVAENYRALAHR